MIPETAFSFAYHNRLVAVIKTTNSPPPVAALCLAKPEQLAVFANTIPSQRMAHIYRNANF